MRMVLVEWEDSFFGIGEWLDFAELKELPTARCISCGILLHETSEKIVLIMNRGGKQGSQPMAIPRGCIKRMRQLKVKEA